MEELLAEHSVISVQVLDEFTSVFRRKFGLSSSECREILGTVRAVCETQPLTVESHKLGIEISDRYGFSVYDSMIESERLTGGIRNALLRGPSASPGNRWKTDRDKSIQDAIVDPTVASLLCAFTCFRKDAGVLLEQVLECLAK